MPARRRRPDRSDARDPPGASDWRRRFGARLGAGLLGTAAVLGGGYFVVNAASRWWRRADGVGPGRSVAGDARGGTMAEDAVEPPTVGFRRTMAYTSATLDEDVQSLLDSPVTSYETRIPPPGHRVPGRQRRSRRAGHLGPKLAASTQPSCQAESDDEPVAIDVGTYNGVQAVVIVLPDRSIRVAPSAVDVWVLDASCVDAGRAAVAYTEFVEQPRPSLTHRPSPADAADPVRPPAGVAHRNAACLRCACTDGRAPAPPAPVEQRSADNDGMEHR